MSDLDRQRRSGGGGNSQAGQEPEVVPPSALSGSRSQPLHDPMAHVRSEREQASAQIDRSLKAWRKESARKEGGAGGVQIPEQGGAALPTGTRAPMERALGADLSSVKVHTGGASAQAANDLGARAFTVGQDVHFGAGQFAPGSKEGDKLLAHELTHTVQAKNAGAGGGAVSRKADGGDGAHAGLEVSQPHEPAEQEADAAAEHATEKLHGAGAAHGDAGHGGQAHGAAAHQPAPIAAKLEGAGRKVYAAGKPGRPAATPAPAAGGPTTTAHGPAGTGPAGPAAAHAPAVDPKQAQIDKAKAVKSEADVDAFCAADPIATQKLRDVKTEVNFDDGAHGAARTAFYGKVAGWIQGNAESVNPKTIYNQCMNHMATEWRFKGRKLDVAKFPKSLNRTQGLGGFWWTAVDQQPYLAAAKGAPDPAKAAMALWIVDAKAGHPLKHRKSGSIAPTGGTWFTPDSYKLKNASDAGFSQLLELAALQPEWFPDGNIVFEIDVTTAKAEIEARRPTAYDGMQSSLWVSRPTGDAYGVTGGGANEFLAGKVPIASIKSAHAVIPSDDSTKQIKDAIQAARDQALAQDPVLKARIENEHDVKARQALEAMIPNLTDMYLRGDTSLSMGAAVKQMLANIKTTTDAERANPSATRAPAQITARTESNPPPTHTATVTPAHGPAGASGAGPAAPTAAGKPSKPPGHSS